MRQATHDDMSRLLEFGRAFHAASQQPFGFDEAATQGFLGNLIDGGVILLTDHGMIGGLLSPAYCDPDWVMAVELFWWADKGGIGLLRGFEAWAKEMGANEVRMTSLAALNRADRLLRAKGFEPAEISYRKVI